MFEALRKNIQTVQDGITSGLQRFSFGDRTPPTPTEPKVNLNAGAEVLEVYQMQWATMHHIAVQNAKEAEKIDSQISALVEECEKQHNQVIEIHSLLAHLPNVMSQLHSMLNTVGSIHNLCEEVETELLALEDINEELVLQEQILDMKLGLTLVREKQNHCLNQLRKELSSYHQVKINHLEIEREKRRKEKETTLTNKFLEDLKNYQEHGCIKSPTKEKDCVKLEDIDLQEDLSRLDSFLNEAT